MGDAGSETPLAPGGDDRLEREVDEVLESHRAVLAGVDGPGSGFRTLREDLGRTTGVRFPRITEEDALERHKAGLRHERRERAQLAALYRPTSDAPRLDPPLVTRGGVLYVPPAFEQAAGLDEDAAHRLLRAGFRSVDTFLAADDEEIATVTGRPAAAIRRARRDLDLTTLPHVDRKTADVLRLAGCTTVSRLAIIDPALLERDVTKILDRHRFMSVPAALDGPRAFRRLVAAAQARSE